MICKRVRDLLPRYVDEDLEPAERALVAGHLEACAACRRRLALNRELPAALAEMPTPPEEPQRLARLRRNVLATVERERAWRPLRRTATSIGNGMVWLSVSAVVVALILALWVTWRPLVERRQGRTWEPTAATSHAPGEASFFNEPLPADRTYHDAAQSPDFRLRGSVTLRGEAGEGRRQVLFDVTVENRTQQPIRGLRVKAELPEAVRAYRDPGYASFRVFGQPEPVDLVPGQAPLGLTVGCEEALPDPVTATSAERERLYEALRQPLRLGLWWEGGEAYLELQPEDILYTGFPEWAAGEREPVPLRARVELDIYTDRPNPSWELAERETNLQVVAALFKGGYPPRDESPRCDPQSGYRGFTVTLTDGPRGLPLGLRVCGGRIDAWEVGSEAEPEVVQDLGHELEWYLLESGQPYLDAQVYEAVHEEIERNTQPEDAIPYAQARVQEYRLARELPPDLPGEAPVYRVVGGPVPEAEWAQQLAQALGFAGDPVGESESAAQPQWTWAGPGTDQVLTVHGSIGYQCSAPPAGAEKRPKLASAEEAIAAARAWLLERELLPEDCAGDVQAWPGVEGLGWEVSFRRRLDGVAVGSYWSWSGGVRVRLNSLGQVDFMTYVRRDVEAGEPVALKGAQAAWAELQSRGPAFFDAEGPATGPEYGVFTIEEVRLGYREGGVGTAEEQTELRPYYVFGGRAEVPVAGQEVRLEAYVPAEAAPLPPATPPPTPAPTPASAPTTEALPTSTPPTGPVPTLAAVPPTGG